MGMINKIRSWINRARNYSIKANSGKEGRGEMSEKQIAIMKNVGIGCRDIGSPILYYDVYISECTAALNTMSWNDAYDFIKAYGVYDVKHLEGKPVWVKSEGGRTTTLEPCVIK
jgi:hypothetical protein